MTDYISREAALAFQDELAVLLCKDVVTGDVMSATKDADLVKYLLSIPAADVRPVVRGRDICDTVNGHCEFKCSVCGVELSSIYGGNNDFGLDGGYFNYCPNCGADMRGESDV